MRKRKLTTFEKDTVKKIAGARCEYCKFPMEYSHDYFHIDHIIPPRHGGVDDFDNFAYACDGCNSKKWIRTEWQDPETGMTVPLYHPRRDNWDEHFGWNQDYSLMLGLIPKGRATIELLQTNRPGLVNIQKVLHEKGLHPPV